jgi:NAD(P)H-nitrite reductase large subunit
MIRHKESFAVAQSTSTSDISSSSYRESSDILIHTDIEIWMRVTAGEEYVKIIVQNNKIIGAILVGDTDLEEAVENLILNELDVSRFGIDLLNPNIDVEGYFD